MSDPNDDVENRKIEDMATMKRVRVSEVKDPLGSVLPFNVRRRPSGKWQKLSFSHEMSLPGLTNNIGSLQIEADPIALKHVVFPPVSAAEETTGMTWLDGSLFVASGRSIQARWSLPLVERRGLLHNWGLSTRTAMVPYERAVVVEVELENLGPTTRSADLQLRLSGRSRNTGDEGYLWVVPAVATSVTALNGPEGHDVREDYDSETRAVLFFNKMEACCSMQGICGISSTWADGWTKVPVTVKSGRSVKFHVLLCYGSNKESVRDTYILLSKDVQSLVPRAESYWNEQWRGMQEVSQNYDRSLRKLPLSLRSLHDMALATSAYLRRDYSTKSPKSIYLTLFPRHGEGSFYLWDIGMAAPFIARVDPSAVKAMVEMVAAGVDIYGQQCVNAFTGKGGGWYYAANPWSVFRLVWSVLCATKDLSWLDVPLTGIRRGQTVLGMLEELALAWTLCCPGQRPLVAIVGKGASRDAASSKSLVETRMPEFEPGGHYPFAVADCGDRGTLLEATTTYQYQVASINAGFVWMMRCLAEIHNQRGEFSQAKASQSLANRLAAGVLAMYRPKDGFFSCGYRDGRIIPSRVGLDHLMVMNCMAEDLSPSIRSGLIRSFERELRTKLWMRIVSDRNHDVMSGCRSDTTFVGSYAGWVAMMAEGLCRIGAMENAKEFLESVSPITAQGPIAQSYWTEMLRAPFAGGAAKSTDEMPQGTHWCEMGGVTFGSAIVHGLLGEEWTPFSSRISGLSSNGTLQA